MSSVNLRRVLVVFQFCISAFLIGGTGVVLNQLNFMRAENLGFEPEKILVLGAFSARERQEADRFMDNIRDLTAVQSVTQSNAVPGRPTISYSYHVGSMKEDEFQVIDVLFTDPAFGETYELDMAAGRDFSWDFGADSTGSFIVNEAFVREVGWTPDEAVGQEFTMTRGSGTIVGVYKDFHYKSLHENFAPMAFSSVPVAYGSAPLLLSLRILTGDVETTISDIENRWKAMMPDRPFEYFFLDDDFEKQYRADGQLGRIFSAFGALAIIIACLGLFGLAALTAEQKTREIGIRKALGASALSVVSLFTRQFLKLIVFAIAIAIPLIWFAAERWLENFAFRIDVGIGLFVGTALLLGVIATLTILVQSIRAALANPIDSLRHE